MKLIVDSDVLIKLAKTSLKETATSAFTISIPRGVVVESVDRGKEAGFPDALKIEENIRQNRIAIRTPRRNQVAEPIVRDLRLASGEGEVLLLFRSGGYDAVASDDRRFLQTLDALRIPYLTSSSLLVLMVRMKHINARQALVDLERLAEFIGENEYLLARNALGDML